MTEGALAPVPPRADVQGAFPCPGADSPHGIRPGVCEDQRLNRCLAELLRYRVEQYEQNHSYYYLCAICRDSARWEGRSKLPGARAPATQFRERPPRHPQMPTGAPQDAEPTSPT